MNCLYLNVLGNLSSLFGRIAEVSPLMCLKDSHAADSQNEYAHQNDFVREGHK